MAVTYTWEVTGIKTRTQTSADNQTLEGAIVQTYWKKIGTDENGNTGTFSGATPFTAENLNLADFTALSSVTEEQVLGWIKDRVVDDYENHVNQQIQKQIDAVVNPITEATLPWASVEAEATDGPAE